MAVKNLNARRKTLGRDEFYPVSENLVKMLDLPRLNPDPETLMLVEWSVNLTD